MKKVLSVVLAAAMVLGMSVSAFAAEDNEWGNGPKGGESEADVEQLWFYDYMTVKRDKTTFTVNCDTNEISNSTNAKLNGKEFTFEPGDIVYFNIMTEETNVAWNNNSSAYIGEIDADWSVNIKANDFVDDAYFVAETSTGFSTKAANLTDTTSRKYVCVEIVEDYDDLSKTSVNFYMYIADNDSKTKSAKATVKYAFDNINEKYVDFDFSNDADHAAKWIVRDDEKGTAVFDFEDDVYFTVKMIPEEKVILNLDTSYVKSIDKEYNEYDAELDFYNFKGDNDAFTKKGELFIPSSKDNKFIYEVVDGELVAVEAEYTTTYKVGGVSNTAKKGYVIETKELGFYVVADDELVVAEAEEPATTTDAAKPNPGTGASDFVGAAVALAVVSVAAAGALAFKK